jgi:hypothetical protein
VDLLDAYLDGRLDEAGRAELSDRLRSSPRACRAFWEHVHQHALLIELLAEARGREMAEQEVALACVGPARLAGPQYTPPDSHPAPLGSRGLLQARARGVRRRRALAWLGLTAAAVLVAVGVAWMVWAPATRVETGEIPSLARLGDFKGHVRILAGEELLPARPGQLLRPGEEVHTGEDSSAVVTYDDASRLELSADTAVRLLKRDCRDRRDCPSKHVFLVRGVVNAHVTRQPAGRPLLLSTDQADLLVPGTRFSSANILGETRIELEEGTALLARKGEQAVEIRTGTYAVSASDLDFYSAAPLVPASGQPFAVLKEGSGPVLALARLPGRSELAVACWNGLVKLWDPGLGQVRAVLDARMARTLALAASPDGRTLAAGYEPRDRKSRPPCVVLWDVPERRARLVLPNTFRTRALEFTPDRGSLVMAAGPPGVGVRDLPLPGRPVETRDRLVLGDRLGRVESLAVSPDGTLVAAGYRDGKIRLWDLRTGRLARCLEGHTREVKALAFQPGGQVLASGGRDGTLRLWSLASGEELRQLRGPAKEVRCLAFSPDGLTLASGHAGLALLWSVAKGEKRSTLKAHKFAITALGYLDDGQALATAGWDRTVKLWRLEPAR